LFKIKPIPYNVGQNTIGFLGVVKKLIQQPASAMLLATIR
jgi:hypothetical protein